MPILTTGIDDSGAVGVLAHSLLRGDQDKEANDNQDEKGAEGRLTEGGHSPTRSQATRGAARFPQVGGRGLAVGAV